MILKEDTSKAYDMLELDYLLSMLCLKGVSAQNLKWFVACLKTTNMNGLIEGYPADGKRIFITHQLFVDDLILVGKTSLSEVLSWEQALRVYAEAAGVLVGVRNMKAEDWMPFLERISGKLTQWPHRFLNLAGKQATYCPMGWDKVTSPLRKGGLGIRDPYLLEDFRGVKRCWDFLQEGQRKWKEVLLSKYCFDMPIEDMLRGTLPRRLGSDAWKLIFKHWEEVVGKTFPSPGHEAKGHTKVEDFFDFENNKWKLIATLVDDDNGFVDYQILRATDNLNEELSQVDIRIGDTTLTKIEGLQYGSKDNVFESRSFYESIHERMKNPRMRPYLELNKWRVDGPIVCQMCKEGQPNLNHIWWQCPSIRALWHSILEIINIE
eukprot:Gb_06583 [translate_table: standard]